VSATSAAVVAEQVVWLEAYNENTPVEVSVHLIVPSDVPKFALHASEPMYSLMSAMWSSQSPLPRTLSSGTAAFSSQKTLPCTLVVIVDVAVVDCVVVADDDCDVVAELVCEDVTVDDAVDVGVVDAVDVTVDDAVDVGVVDGVVVSVETWHPWNSPWL